jgi:hypothetical protein
VSEQVHLEDDLGYLQIDMHPREFVPELRGPREVRLRPDQIAELAEMLWQNRRRDE